MKMGKIIVLKVKMLVEFGWFVDNNDFNFMFIISGMKKYNYGIFDLIIIFCRINNVFKIVVWVFGDVEGFIIVDVIVDYVVFCLGISGN